MPDGSIDVDNDGIPDVPAPSGSGNGVNQPPAIDADTPRPSNIPESEFSEFAGLPLVDRERLLPDSAFRQFLRSNQLRPGGVV